MLERQRQPRWLRPTALLLALAGHSACSAAPHPAATSSSAGTAPRGVRSNVRHADYVGSAACAACHGEIYQAWQHSPMHRMTRPAEDTDIRARFDGARFQLGEDTALVEQSGKQRFFAIQSAAGTRRYRVTKVIGGRHREDFVGIELSARTADPERDAGRGREQVLPLSFVFATESWRYKGYSVMLPERPGLRAGPTWAATCIGCHNTLPYLVLAYDDLLGPAAAAYQGSIHDSLLPPERRWTARVTDADGLKGAVVREVQELGGSLPAALADASAPLESVLSAAIEATRHELGGEHVVELGVGCESCHGGAREHASNAGVPPRFGVESPLFEIGPRSAEATRAERINRTCAHCHSVLLSAYPWTWEGGRRRDAVPGGSTTNSGEGRDFLLGGCSQQMSCTSCHDPHAADRAEQLAALATPAGNGVCLGCHQALASETELARHTHHAAAGEGSACVACHLPRKNMGLDYQLTRYHRIGSPTDEARVLGDRPIECALCHAEKSVETLTADLERWWGKRYPREALRKLYGPDLKVNVLLSTLERGKPHEQAVAIATLGERRVQSAVPLLLPQLSQQYPLVRFYAKAALEHITGQPLPVDVNGSVPQIRAEAGAWFAARRAE